jgi:hypothetical protein
MGVTGVTNQVVVKPRSTPAGLKEKTEEAPLRSAKADAALHHGGRECGKGDSEGDVRTRAEREAERVAWSAAGVASVDNRIAVSD